ncbi:MAG: phosphohydrolase [Actinomycetota bacterium]|nr:phosphohydrolase [Actinomycetota bacterium]
MEVVAVPELGLPFGVDAAICIAAWAHADKRDKGRPNLPYVTHPVRVMAAFDDPDLQAIAVLHDVVEDSLGTDREVTLDDLAAVGASARVIDALRALTHLPGEGNASYWGRVRTNPDAQAVKRADIADNNSEERLALLDPALAERLRAKYVQATDAIG